MLESKIEAQYWNWALESVVWGKLCIPLVQQESLWVRL